MIDQQLLESAKIIRRDFLTLTKKLNVYQDDVKNLGKFLLNKAEQLKEFQSTIKDMRNHDDLNRVTKHILNEIEEIETEERKLKEKVEKINLEMEKLRKDEEILYDTIKTRYPSLTDEQIIKEVHSHL